MAKILNLPGQAVIDGFKGTLDYYVHDGVACVRKWPRSPGHIRTPAVMAGWPAFTESNQLWSSLSLNIKEAWNNMAIGIPLTGKDLFVKSYITNTFITIEEEG